MGSVVGAAAALIQRAYEGGRISYPRTESVQLDGDVVREISAVAQSRGLVWDAPAPLASGTPRQAHEALSPVAPLGLLPTEDPLTVLEPLDQVAFRLLRGLLRAGRRQRVEAAAPDPGDPPWAADLSWWRPSEAMPAWLRRPVEAEHVLSGLVLYEPDEIALRALVEAGLGKPSTLASHAARVAELGFVGVAGLTPAGRSALDAAPDVLQMPATCRHVETALEAVCDEGRSPEEAVWHVLDGLPALAPRIMAALAEAESEGPRFSSHPAALVGDDEMARRRSRRRKATAAGAGQHGLEEFPPSSPEAGSPEVPDHYPSFER